MPASAKPRVTRATWSTDTPFFIRASSRSDATSRPPEMAMHPLSASCWHSAGVKVFSKRMLPHHEMATRRRCNSWASALRDFGGAASSTK